MDSLLRDVRLYVYSQMLETAAAPTAADTAAALGRSIEDIRAAFRGLADRRMLVLRPNSDTIWMAMPFSNAATPFTVISGGRAYYANCAWDAFGIPAMLQGDAHIFTTCADCGEVMERKVAAGAVPGTGVVHFALPPRRWWDDVGFT